MEYTVIIFLVLFIFSCTISYIVGKYDERFRWIFREHFFDEDGVVKKYSRTTRQIENLKY